MSEFLTKITGQSPEVDKKQDFKKRAVRGLALMGLGSLWLGIGFGVGFSRMKRKSKDHAPQTFSHPNHALKEEGSRLARRALAYGSLCAFMGVGAIIGVTCFMLDIRSTKDLKGITQASMKNR